MKHDIYFHNCVSHPGVFQVPSESDCSHFCVIYSFSLTKSVWLLHFCLEWWLNSSDPVTISFLSLKLWDQIIHVKSELSGT